MLVRTAALGLSLIASGLTASWAQTDAAAPVRFFEPHTGQEPTAPSGQVRMAADPKVEQLMKAYTEHRRLQKGYRVQIFLGDRKTAEDTKRQFLQKNPEMAAYLSWLAPNFRLRVGDCRTRLEAERLLRDLRTAYPGSYIVPDEIEMPPLAKP